jgi:hypothetical protein
MVRHIGQRSFHSSQNARFPERKTNISDAPITIIVPIMSITPNGSAKYNGKYGKSDHPERAEPVHRHRRQSFFFVLACPLHVRHELVQCRRDVVSILMAQYEYVGDIFRPIAAHPVGKRKQCVFE